jgi:ketosteroid isomerase-like protein
MHPVKHGASVLLLASIGFACAGPTEQPAGLSAEDVAAIRKLTEEDFTALAAAHDFEGVGGLVTENAVIMPFGEAAQEGKATIVDVLDRNWGSLPIAEFTQNTVKIDGRGDLAYARGTYAIKVQGEGMPEIRDQGKYLQILEKQPDGRWLVSTAAYSRNTARPEVMNE